MLNLIVNFPQIYERTGFVDECHSSPIKRKNATVSAKYSCKLSPCLILQNARLIPFYFRFGNTNLNTNIFIMKKEAMLTTLIVLAVLFLANNGIAQTKIPQSGMAISLSIVEDGLVLNDVDPARVNAKAMRDFSKRFNGKQANWSNAGDVFQAKFSDETIRTVVGYGKSGRWLYTIKHYSEKELSRDIRHMVKSEYYDYKIDLIDEVRIPQSKNEIYLIHIHNEEKQHKILRYSEDGIELIKNYTEKQDS